MYKPKALEFMVNYLENNKETDLISCDFDFVNEKKEFKDKFVDLVKNRNPLQLIKQCNVGACFMYTKEIAQKIGEYDTEMFCAEDYDYWCRLALLGNIDYSDENLYIYRNNNESLTATRQKTIQEKTFQVRMKYIVPLIEKYNINKNEQIKILYKFYRETNNKTILNIAKNIDIKLLTIYRILNFLYSKTKTVDKKIIKICGIKITFKRKNIKYKTTDYLKFYQNAKKWINNYSVEKNGIVVTSENKNLIYPEVTGYFIPTLLKYGDRKRAKSFGDYLLAIQNKDGSWNDPSGDIPYTFDTGMILKGLCALIENGIDEDNKYQKAFLKGCDWIVTMQRGNGSIATPDYSWWELPYEKRVPEAIHVYCLEPLRKASQMYGNKKYENCVQKALKYYLAQKDLTDFNTLSHFNAYIIEGLIDIGEVYRAKRAMDLIGLHQKFDGSIPAYSNVDFVCSTGLFQYAICWYKLGEIEKADKAFNYTCKLQNKSGGWFGSYGKNANYFPKSEISWAVKYFLDAIYYGQCAKYNKIKWSTMWDKININDERYQVLLKEFASNNYQKILDLGCGKGRYTKQLKQDFPNREYYCVDITNTVLKNIDFCNEKKVGTILNIPYQDNYFDFIFLTESLEHCIDIENAITEISRVLQSNGKLVIIDKDKKKLGKLELAEFEQWFDKKVLCKILEKHNLKTEIKENLRYENVQDGLFNGWIGVKK